MENVLRWLARGCVDEEKGGLSWPESHRTRELRRRKVGWSGRISRQAGRQPCGLARSQPQAALRGTENYSFGA